MKNIITKAIAITTIGLTSCIFTDDSNPLSYDPKGLNDFYIYNVDQNTNTLINKDPNTTEWDYSLSPDNKTILYQNTDGINLMAIDGTSNRLLTKGYCPSFSFTGDTIVYINNDTIFTIKSDGTNSKQITFIDSIDYSSPRWLPNGKQIVSNSNYGLCLVNMHGDTEVISSNDQYDSNDGWCIFGNEIFYYKYDDEYIEQIYKYDISNKKDTVLTESPTPNFAPKHNPVDNTIAYLSGSNNKGVDLIIMNTDGSNETTILHQKKIYSTTWSPNGNQIAFINENGNIAVIDKDGSNYKVINQTKGACLYPVWSSDGKFILYYRWVY